MDNYEESFIALLINYEALPFPSTIFNNIAAKLSPFNWWKTLRFYGMQMDFLESAAKLLSCPDNDDWCFTATFVGRTTSKGNEVKSKIKQPSDMSTLRFEHGW